MIWVELLFLGFNEADFLKEGKSDGNGILITFFGSVWKLFKQPIFQKQHLVH